ncbi:MAG: type IX secretion system outer membrane channel protein PorV [Bacteroidia bacterium]|nr:type IX secretion system outer membrane channel protein PorV [Bacteroidia bacterium]MCZ2248773.1 type IX secretion system outer membrane channel protein PorV [Bacteroidia bacterium]
MKNSNWVTCIYVFAILASGKVSLAQKKSSLTGQEVSLNTITTSVPFLSIGPDSRAGGMGDCGVASSPDVNSMHWNAAKYAFIEKKTGFALNYTPWLRRLVPDINFSYLSGYYKLDKNQAIAGSLRYFSLGDITFTDVNGQTIGQFRPNEFSVDLGYARKLSSRFSTSLALRYVYSNLTSGINVAGANTKPGQAVAADIGAYYQNNDITLGGKKTIYSFGLNISNVGSKISYSETAVRDFIPQNLKIGNSITFELDDYNKICFMVDFNKLLVPTPPRIARDSTGSPIYGADGNLVLSSGKPSNVGPIAGVVQSFYDAPDGIAEELREVMWAAGMEYWYDNLFALRTGYFHEAPSKGNRQYFNIGAGLRYNVFGIDFAYLIPTVTQNPLQNTLRFTLTFNFDAISSGSVKENNN